MDVLSPDKPIGKTYFALWCRAWDDPFVRIGAKLLELSLEAGFSGPRSQNSLCTRLAILQKLGFVRFAPGPGGVYSFALILNPYLVLKKYEKKLGPLYWNTLRSRMLDIGADDFSPKPRKPPMPPVDLSALFPPVVSSPVPAAVAAVAPGAAG
jgi:hypothetical protein